VGGFMQALSALAPIAPALSDARDIRTQRERDAQTFASDQALKQAQLTIQQVAAQEGQQRLRAGNQPLFKPGSQPEFNPLKGTYTQPAWNPDKGVYEEIPVPGVSPEETEKYQLESVKRNRAAAAQLMPDASPEDLDYLAYTLSGLKPPAAKFTPLPGAAGQPQPGPDGQSYVWGRNADGEIVTRSMGPGYKPPPAKVLPINTEYVQIMGKDPSTWTPQEQQFIKGYGAYLKAQETLAGARGAAYNASRPVQVQADDGSGNAVIMPAGEAERLGTPTTQSIPFRVQYATESALNRYFVAGKGGENIRTLNTAVSHLALLRQLSDALGNGDVRVWNSLRQSYARATGNPAPINFDMLRDSLAGEMARVFTGVGATQQEIAEITGPISNSNSPAQLSGAIDTAQAAMNSRLTALKQQYAAGRQGLPAFQGGAGGGGNQPPASPAAPPPNAANPLGLNLPGLPAGGPQ
jgi:hypothetical protein